MEREETHWEWGESAERSCEPLDGEVILDASPSRTNRLAIWVKIPAVEDTQSGFFMKVLLRNSWTGQYYRGPSDWADNGSEAWDFKYTCSAVWAAKEPS